LQHNTLRRSSALPEDIVQDSRVICLHDAASENWNI
jgi:hypothetical protein